MGPIWMYLEMERGLREWGEKEALCQAGKLPEFSSAHVSKNAKAGNASPMRAGLTYVLN